MSESAAVAAHGLAEKDFRRFQQLVFEVAGIHLSAAKRSMVAGRLAKRLKALQLVDFTSYVRCLDSDPEERRRAVDLLTTNETYFFREPKHFEFLREQVLAHLPEDRPVRVWSAACSSGEEAYSLAMLLDDVLGTRGWEVMGSDISSRVLQRARRGLYPMARIDLMPSGYLKRYCMKGTGQYTGQFLVSGVLRERVGFSQVNLNAALPQLGAFDVIFLRNVMIYFSVQTKSRVVRRVLNLLRPGGYFFVGHAESLVGIADGLQTVRPSIYRKLQ